MALGDLNELANALRVFAREREWEQFHSPRNLAAALCVEASEVLEHFQWLTDEQSRALIDEEKQRVAMELADVLNYLVRMADQLNIDLLKAAEQKLAINAQKYPVERARGTSKKYSDL
jgi:NTP pyrophosphatase (non-canonical NTP hydrolase)